LITEVPSTVTITEGVLRLNKLRFDILDEQVGRSGVLISLNRPTDYQIRRKSKDLYLITIKDAELVDESLAAPHFPPMEVSGFVSMRAQQQGKDIQVYVYVEDGIHLISYPVDSDIRLQVVQE
jgi:hypothetical protein